MFFNLHLTNNREDGSTKTLSTEFDSDNLENVVKHLEDFLIGAGFDLKVGDLQVKPKK
jgi:hypothetical protein